MNRRDTVKAVGASLLGGTALATGGAAAKRRRDGPKVVAVETERIREDGKNQYTVDYRGDGRVRITGYTTAPSPCHEVDVAGITATERGDIVDLEVAPEESKQKQVCATVVTGLRYTVDLQYSGDADDVFVRVP